MITLQNASGLELIDANMESTAVGAYQARQANISILLAALGRHRPPLIPYWHQSAQGRWRSEE